MEFTTIPGYDLSVASSGTSQSRIIIFKTNNQPEPQAWERVEGAQIIIVGQKAKQELKRFVADHSRATASEIIPGGIAGRAYPALRKHLELAK